MKQLPGFIATSTATHFVKPSDESMWRNILASCRADCCPFFVAILSQSQARAMQAKDVRRGKFESVVGFAYAVDFAAPDNAYRITLEFEIWVSTCSPPKKPVPCSLGSLSAASSCIPDLFLATLK